MLAVLQLVPVIHIGSALLALRTADLLAGAKGIGDSVNTDGATGWELVAVNFRIVGVVVMAALPLWVFALFAGAAVRRRRGDLPVWSLAATDPEAAR